MDASALTSYSARCVLPTLAELARFDPHELLWVGDWKGNIRNQQDLSMPMRYADQKEHTSLVVKSELLCKMRRVVQCNAQTSARWDRLSNFTCPRHIPSLGTSSPAKQLISSSAIGLPPPGLPDHAQPRSKALDPRRPMIRIPPPPPPQFQRIQVSRWTVPGVQRLLSKGIRGHLHLCRPLQLQAKRWHTVCNRGLCSPELGTGLEDAFGTGKQWSPRCFQKLPAECRRRWQDLSTNGS